MRRRAVVAILLVAVAVMAAIQLLGGPRTLVRSSGPWRSVPAADSGVRWLDATGDGVLVGGEAPDGGPLVAVVERDRSWPVRVEGDGAVWSLLGGGDRVVVVDDEATARPVGTVLWHLPGLDGDATDPEVLDPYAPTLPDGRAPDRLWLTEEDEGAAAVGGFLDDGDLALVPLDWETWEFVADPPGLYLAADAEATELRVGGTEGSYVVVGPVAPRSGATGTGTQVWVAGTMDDHTWDRVPLDPMPEEVTDLRGWVLDLYLAGPVGDRPVVIEAHGGAPPLAVPDVALDPADPVVLIADVPTGPGERPAVVLQTPDGAVLHRPVDDGWAETPLPPGRADAALLVDDATRGVTAYVVVDGRLWWRALG